ncbi:DNA -binding domain-containing protein [Novosphingobium sp. ZW T3_23]|uniref:DNA -binding domain-containing protein n=1 Tax=Novosphingobium sp. ZW T3_23 TaxID=3378084 RepID=UPI003853C49B
MNDSAVALPAIGCTNLRRALKRPTWQASSLRSGSTGRLSADPKMGRFINVLRVYDGLIAGVSLGVLPKALYGTAVGDAKARRSDSLRSRVRRLVREARGMAARGYRDLMRSWSRLSSHSRIHRMRSGNELSQHGLRTHCAGARLRACGCAGILVVWKINGRGSTYHT